jgi:hypothetical protein
VAQPVLHKQCPHEAALLQVLSRPDRLFGGYERHDGISSGESRKHARLRKIKIITSIDLPSAQDEAR